MNSQARFGELTAGCGFPEDLTFAASRHFWLGCATASLLGCNWALWQLEDRQRAATMHRWVGLVALAMAAVQAALGLSLLP
jgi:hypothetical protein